jgi:hypothetical protein
MDRRPADARHHRLKALMTGAALGMLPAAAFAQTTPEARERADSEGVFSLVLENDSLSSGADRNYTSGIELSYTSPATNPNIPRWLDDAASPFTHFLSGAEPTFWGAAIGQAIFTPQDIQAVRAPPDQHPYAGWLYAQLMVAAEVAPTDARGGHLDTYELEFGMVGPSALGEAAQNTIHKVLGAPGARGWDSQLHDEFAFAASFDRRWRWLPFGVPGVVGLSFDLTPQAGFTVGTLRDEVRAGLIARIGNHLMSDYGPPRVRPSLAGVEHFYGDDFSWSIFLGAEGRAVARDLFLDGNTFRDSAHVERIPYVADFQTGFSMSLHEWRMTYTFVWRTDEFTTQNGRQDFGSLSFSRRF